MKSFQQQYKIVQSYWRKKETIPADWEQVTLKKFIDILPGYAFDSEYFDKKKGISLVRIRDLPNDTTETNYNRDYDKTYIIKKDDLLVGMDGEFKPYLWKGSNALLNQRVCKIYDQGF